MLKGARVIEEKNYKDYMKKRLNEDEIEEIENSTRKEFEILSAQQGNDEENDA